MVWAMWAAKSSSVQEGLARHDVEIRDQAERAVALVLELDALGQTLPCRLGRVDSFECLDARLLVGADDVTPLGSQPSRIRVGLADLADVGFVLLGVLQFVLMMSASTASCVDGDPPF